jgi:uncharacterized protein YndB with AHSA1/START domain
VVAAAGIYTRKETAMWTVEHNIETSALPEQVWRLWADAEGWPEWNTDIERIKLHGSFATGGRIMMTPRGQEAIELRIAEAVEPVQFVDEANLDDVVIRTTHRVELVGNERSRVTYRMEIDGPAAETRGPQLGLPRDARRARRARRGAHGRKKPGCPSLIRRT